MLVVKQVPVCKFILLIFEKGACAFIVYIGNRFPECLLFLDSDKLLNQ